MAYVEGLVGQIYVEGETDTYIYHPVFEGLSDSALSPEDSPELIANIGARYHSGATVHSP